MVNGSLRGAAAALRLARGVPARSKKAPSMHPRDRQRLASIGRVGKILRAKKVSAMKVAVVDRCCCGHPTAIVGQPTGVGGKVWTRLDTLRVRAETDDGIPG
jgi:hypothetical protein